MTDHHQIGNLGPLADFIGDQPGIEKGLRPNIFCRAGIAEVVENKFAAVIEELSHLGGKIEIGFESERA